MSKGKKYVYLSEDEGKLVGYLLVAKSIAGVAFADWLAVDNKYQKKGIATKLISMWEKDAIEEGAHALYLWTTNDYNINFYKNRGFSLSGKFPKAWHGIDTYLMCKILREPKEENYLKNYLKIKNKN